VPFFPTSKFGAAASSNILIALVFGRRDLAESTLPDLQNRITVTESSGNRLLDTFYQIDFYLLRIAAYKNTVLRSTGIIIGALVAGVALIVYIVVWCITSPIEGLRTVSSINPLIILFLNILYRL